MPTFSVLHAPTYRWTVEEYEELGRAGFFDENDRVELLNGEIITMSPIGIRHATAVRLLNNFFADRRQRRYEVDPQNPFILDDASEPQPDLTLVDPAVSKSHRHPRPADLFLIIEVSDSTVPYDREDEGPAYARNGVREYWLLNLDERVLEVYRAPSANGYEERLDFGPDDTVAPLAFPDLVIQVGDFLP
jgi:Uma2 family endonuclease